MRLALYLGWAIIAVAIMIGIWFVINYPVPEAHGQSTNNKTVTVVQPTPTLAQTPTAPNPNFQYLPQKAYVIPFAPEAGIPNTPIPLQAITTAPIVAPAAAPPAAAGGFDIASILSMVVAAGSGLFAKIGFDKAKKVQETSKENPTAIVDTKVVQQELARLLFDWNKEKSNALQDSPSTKLDNLEAEKKQATETAAKA